MKTHSTLRSRMAEARRSASPRDSVVQVESFEGSPTRSRPRLGAAACETNRTATRVSNEGCAGSSAHTEEENGERRRRRILRVHFTSHLHGCGARRGLGRLRSWNRRSFVCGRFSRRHCRRRGRDETPWPSHRLRRQYRLRQRNHARLLNIGDGDFERFCCRGNPFNVRGLLR